jgi:signal transduction histidine kinase/predicted hydrocarbon binding protein
MSRTHQILLTQENPGILRFGGARMVLLDIEASFWGLRRQLEALVGRRLTDAVLQQAGANGGAAFARAFCSADVADEGQALRDCVAAYQAAGFGQFEIEALEWPIGRVLIRGTNAFEAWMMRQHVQKTETPACAYTAGVLVGFVNALASRQDVVCIKRACQAQGADACLFELLPADKAAGTPIIAFDPDPFLSQQLNLLEILFDRMPMGIVIFDRDLVLRRYNPTWAGFIDRYTSLTVSQVVPGARFFDLVPGIEATVAPMFQRVLAGASVHQEDLRLESDGIVSYWDVVFAPLLEDKKVTGIVGVSTDVTERVLAEEQIQRRNEELAALNAIAAIMSRSLDLDQILKDALEEVLRLDLLGAEAKAMICLLDEQTGDLVLAAQQGGPEGLLSLVESISLLDGPCGLAIEAGKVAISDDCWQNEQRLCCWPSTAPHREICLPLSVREKVLGVLNLWLPLARELTTSDLDLLTLISEQISVSIQNARLFQAVRQQHEQLRALSARLSEAEEAERQQLARELHDQVGQNLTALGINLNIARAQIPDSDPMGDAIRARLDDSLALVEQTAGRIRDVMANLHSPVMDDYGLVATLEWYGRQLSTRTDIDIAVQGEELDPRLTARVENALFRIAQEALTNVVKHAQATQATVNVLADGDSVRLIIADDGVGFDPRRLRTAGERQGWGLLSMTERAEAVGGHCHIESHPQKGTQVVVEAPR